MFRLGICAGWGNTLGCRDPLGCHAELHVCVLSPRGQPRLHGAFLQLGVGGGVVIPVRPGRDYLLSVTLAVFINEGQRKFSLN
jgi:hypothetical protein